MSLRIHQNAIHYYKTDMGRRMKKLHVFGTGFPVSMECLSASAVDPACYSFERLDHLRMV